MMIWHACEGKNQIQHLNGTLYRLVENQGQAATRTYTDSLSEQEQLEELIENSKPPIPDADDSFHYLLTTPFRYPPLQFGSRFGHSDERSIFYGSHLLNTTLTESAYYRFVFRKSIQLKEPDDTIKSQHTLFSVDYRSDYGIKLHNSPFDHFKSQLTSPTDYTQTQKVGAAMRNANVEVFEYESARDPDRGICVGIFSMNAFVQNTPNSQSQWFCDTNTHSVTFKRADRTGKTSVMPFDNQMFLINGELPMPTPTRTVS